MVKFAKLSDAQLEFISEVLGNLGIVFFASMVVPILSGTKDIFFVLQGAMYSFVCWILGLVILNKSKERR